MTEVKTLPTHDVRVIGRKFLGSDGLEAALGLGISLITAAFHSAGTLLVIKQVLKRWSRAGRREEQRFKMVHGIASSGLGADPFRHFFRVKSNSLRVIRL